MNERIQELAVKAKLMAEEDINRQISYNTELKAFAEKFAELIMKECIRVPYDKWDKAELNADIAVKIEYRIRDHFGVEE